jgi:hypothetical protein
MSSTLSHELYLIATLRDEKLQSIFFPHITPDLVVEDVARIALETLKDAQVEDLAAVSVTLKKRVHETKIYNDIMRAFSEIAVPFESQRVREKMIKDLERYIRWRKVATQVDYMSSQDLNSVIPITDKDSSYQRLIDACNFAINIQEEKTTFRFDVEEDYERAKQQSMPNGRPMPSTSRLINDSLQTAGYLAGTVNMIVAPPGVGKSTFMVQEGVAFVKNGVKVLHYIFGDLQPIDVCRKYIANYKMTSLSTVELQGDDALKDATVKDMFSSVIFRVMGAYTMNADEIYADAARIKDKFDFGAIMVDYDGNITPAKLDSMYLEGGYTYGMFEKLSRQTESILMCGCQPKNDWWGKEPIPLEAASESSKKQHVIDLMVTFSKPKRQIPVGLLHLPKVRRGETGRSVNVAYLNGFASIVEIKKEERKKIEQWYKDSEDAGRAELMKWAREEKHFKVAVK